MPRLELAELVDLTTLVLAKAGAPPEAAALTAAAVVYAEASGITSHGLVRIPFLADQASSGKIRADAQPQVRRAGDALFLVDAGLGFGYVAAHRAVDALIAALTNSPVVVAAVSNSHHFGVAGQYAERIALAGYVGIAVSGTFGAIAPIGGRRPLLGNPPIALAAPRAEGGPLIIDFAPAVVARGRIASAAQRNEEIPPNWALDARGQPTTSAPAALEGTMQAIGGDKGVLIAMLLDTLVAVTTSSLLPGEAPSVFIPDGPPPRLGHLFLGFDPLRFGNPHAATKIDRYLAALTGDGARMRVPGQRRREARLRAESEGLQVERDILDDLRTRARLFCGTETPPHISRQTGRRLMVGQSWSIRDWLRRRASGHSLLLGTPDPDALGRNC